MKRIIFFGLLCFLVGLSSLSAYGQPRGSRHQGRYTGFGRQPHRQQPFVGHRQMFPVYVIYSAMFQERIPVDVVTAEGVRAHDNRTTRVTFYLGRCRNGDIWCQAGVTPARFLAEDEALRWVEEMMDLVPMSIRQTNRRSVGPPWFISN